MYPSEWPLWLRESAPGWVVVAVLIWFALQRYLDKPKTARTTVLPHDRPTKDPRIICALIGFATVAWVHIGSRAVGTHLQPATHVALAVITVIGVLLSIAGAYIRDEWASIGLELVGCIFLAGTFTVYAIGYHSTVHHWAIISAFFALGNTLRVIQLLRRIR